MLKRILLEPLVILLNISTNSTIELFDFFIMRSPALLLCMGLTLTLAIPHPHLSTTSK